MNRGFVSSSVMLFGGTRLTFGQNRSGDTSARGRNLGIWITGYAITSPSGSGAVLAGVPGGASAGAPATRYMRGGGGGGSGWRAGLGISRVGQRDNRRERGAER